MKVCECIGETKMTNKQILDYMWESKDWRLEQSYVGSLIYIYSTKYEDYGHVARYDPHSLRVNDSVTGIDSLKSVFLDSNNVLRHPIPGE